MVTTIEYALLAGACYRDTRADLNRFPIPANWSVVSLVPQDPSTGFEASAYRNSLANDIVISYAGTDPADLLGDIAADIGLATGLGSAQLLQAAEYYLQVQAANPTTSITFTGHSLGGGLAALMGVFFGKQAVTFDQAPFANSAELNVLTPDIAANLKADLLASGHTEAELAGLTGFLQLRAVTGGIPNDSLVTSINVQGEFLSGVHWNLPDRIGIPVTIPNSAPGVSGFDLHSQALLTAFLQSIQTAAPQQTLHDVTFKLTDLMGMIFANDLYARSTGTANTTEENFLERLVQNETGNEMVTRFTSDLWKLAQDGGLTIADDPTAATNLVSKALTAFAMQMYYENTANAANANKELFTEVTGGVQFDRADVAATLDQAKGYSLYFQDYLNSSTFASDELQLIQSVLLTLRDWYVQAGTNGMNAADAHNRGAFMLGGSGMDTLTGGSQADLLVGNAGIDRLNGGGGNDTLLGGAGFDTYIYNAGDGIDQIEDSDATGKIVFNGGRLQGGISTDGGVTYASLDGTETYVLSGGHLIVNSVLTVNANFQSGQFGIRLLDATEANYDNGLPTNTVLGTAGNDTIVTGGVPGTVNAIVQAGGGDDFVLASANNDQVFGDAGNDTLFGNSFHDRLYGGDGNDFLAGDNDDVSVIDGDDFLDGGAGADTLIGGWGDDVLYGGTENDILYGDTTGKAQGTFTANDYLDGGDGNDELHGLAGNDVLYGGTGNDFLSGEEGDDLEDGGAGDDLMLAYTGNDSLAGGAGIDTLYGDQGNDILDGGDDADTLYGGDGADELFGAAAADILLGDHLNNPSEFSLAGGADFLDGGAGNDHLEGGAGNDSIFGGADNDLLFGQEGADSLFGDDGADELQGGTGNDLLGGDAGDDRLFGQEGDDTLYGDEGNDALAGNEGNDTLVAGVGNDVLEGSHGDDVLNGGTGLDTYFYRTGQGLDRIVDADKIGTIQFDGQTLVGGLRRMGKTFCFQACMLGAGHSAMNSFLRKAA